MSVPSSLTLPKCPDRPGGDPSDPAGARPGFLAALRSALREIALVAVLFGVYKVGRLAADGHVDEAFRNARVVWDVERWLHLPGELAVQHTLLGWPALVEIANTYYAYVHFPATAACLIWLYLFRPAHYRWTRNVLTLLTSGALLVHFVIPLAPPRMLTDTGMLDLGHLFGPAVYGNPETDHFSNQYAAMPSLHFGWALVVAIALISAIGGRHRALWLLHPAITLLVIVATGNHYWLDAIAAAALTGAAYALLRNYHPDQLAPAAAPNPPAATPAEGAPLAGALAEAAPSAGALAEGAPLAGALAEAAPLGGALAAATSAVSAGAAATAVSARAGSARAGSARAGSVSVTLIRSAAPAEGPTSIPVAQLVTTQAPKVPSQRRTSL
ncbi:phosphatase PAP2 family protein [Actinoplanes sp. CA-015351]|uniref:phosphatase PAP2 family protein n=1 Tax=Actinoplanes sp. CA-015351 TaxID=3239897 RepID=UPI003D95CA76